MSCVAESLKSFASVLSHLPDFGYEIDRKKVQLIDISYVHKSRSGNVQVVVMQNI